MVEKEASIIKMIKIKDKVTGTQWKPVRKCFHAAILIHQEIHIISFFSTCKLKPCFRKENPYGLRNLACVKLTRTTTIIIKVYAYKRNCGPKRLYNMSYLLQRDKHDLCYSWMWDSFWTKKIIQPSVGQYKRCLLCFIWF